MARSRKKHGVLKDTSDNWYNRKFRRVNRQRIKERKRPFLMNELIDKYDVCDHWMLWDSCWYYKMIKEGLYSEEEVNDIKRKYFAK